MIRKIDLHTVFQLIIVHIWNVLRIELSLLSIFMLNSAPFTIRLIIIFAEIMVPAAALTIL